MVYSTIIMSFIRKQGHCVHSWDSYNDCVCCVCHCNVASLVVRALCLTGFSPSPSPVLWGRGQQRETSGWCCQSSNGEEGHGLLSEGAATLAASDEQGGPT